MFDKLGGQRYKRYTPAVRMFRFCAKVILVLVLAIVLSGGSMIYAVADQSVSRDTKNSVSTATAEVTADLRKAKKEIIEDEQLKPVVILPPEVNWVKESNYWRIPLTVLNSSHNDWKVELAGITVEGKPINRSQIISKGMNNFEVPVFNSRQWIDSSELNLIKNVYEKLGKGLDIEQDELRFFKQALKRLNRMAEQNRDKLGPVEIELRGAVSELGLQLGEEYEVQLNFKCISSDGGEISLNANTTAAILSYPTRSGWFHGDLHVHSNFSDGTYSIYTLKGMFSNEYEFVYLTDHSDLLWGYYSQYSAECQRNSDSTISFFPGVEITAANGAGDALAHGVKNLTNLENRTYSCQQLIDNINNNNSGISTSSIAHPYGNPDWTDWNVCRYYGYELMSGGTQINFDFNAIEISKWRNELTRCINDTFNYGYRPSARAGTDFHYVTSWLYQTWVFLPTDWKSKSYSDKKSYLDQSLKAGRTSISKKGSLAVFSINGNPIGTVLKNVPVGTSLNFYVWFCPILNGTYSISIYEGTSTHKITKTYSMTAGQPVSFTHSLPSHSGRTFYWIYVSGPDYAYTSPIYVSSGS